MPVGTLAQTTHVRLVHFAHMSLFGFIYQYPYAATIIGALQLLFIIHALVNRRQPYWIFALLIGSVLAVVLYFFLEIMPDLRGRRLRVNVAPALEGLRSQDSRIKARREQLAEIDTLQNRVALAAELARAERYGEAEEVLAPMRSGIYRDDPSLLYQLADLAYRQGKLTEARDYLEQVDAMRSQTLQAQVKTLLADVYAQLGEKERAERTYQDGMRGATTEAPRVKYIEFLICEGRLDEARTLLDQVEKTYRRANNLYRSQEREWFQLARELRGQLK